MTIPAFPLEWPAGWKRTSEHQRTRARFGRARRARASGGWDYGRPLTIAEATGRVRGELDRMGIADDDLVISTNLQLRLDGLPRSGQREPSDPGAAVYWRTRGGETRCMAIDRYDRVADNLAAIAATLDAMRAIERHGGAAILDRAFTGFTALPPPVAGEAPWYHVLDVDPDDDYEVIVRAYRYERSSHHPDRGGDPTMFNRVQKAWDQYLEQKA
ncbi:MAG: hypothetical protein M0Q49_02430 [Porticoccaceae bacterium]|nr:hypothetical protein [Porticoccaceae bacterium]